MKSIISFEKFNEIIKSDEIVIVYFHNEKCSVCNSLMPKIIEFADYNNYKLYFVNSQEYPEIPAQKLLMTFPAVMVYFCGYEIIKMARFIDLAKLKLELDTFKNRFNL